MNDNDGDQSTPGTPENRNSSARLNIDGDEELLPSTKIKKNVINSPVDLIKNTDSITNSNFDSKKNGHQLSKFSRGFNNSKVENRLTNSKNKFSSFLENNKLKLKANKASII